MKKSNELSERGEKKEIGQGSQGSSLEVFEELVTYLSNLFPTYVVRKNVPLVMQEYLGKYSRDEISKALNLCIKNSISPKFAPSIPEISRMCEQQRVSKAHYAKIEQEEKERKRKREALEKENKPDSRKHLLRRIEWNEGVLINWRDWFVGIWGTKEDIQLSLIHI